MDRNNLGLPIRRMPSSAFSLTNRKELARHSRASPSECSKQLKRAQEIQYFLLLIWGQVIEIALYLICFATIAAVSLNG
jgi:hypothetical protein